MPWLVHVLFVIVMRIACVCFPASCCALWCVLCDVKVTTFSVMQTCIIICNACASCALLAAVCAVRHGRTRICALFPPFPLYCPLCAGWWQVRSRCPLAPWTALASNAAAPLRWPCPGCCFSVRHGAGACLGLLASPGHGSPRPCEGPATEIGLGNPPITRICVGLS